MKCIKCGYDINLKKEKHQTPDIVCPGCGEFISRCISGEVQNQLRERDNCLEDYNLSACPHCNCMTKSILKSRAHYICGKCGKDKTLGDLFQYEQRKEKNNNV